MTIQEFAALLINQASNPPANPSNLIQLSDATLQRTGVSALLKQDLGRADGILWLTVDHTQIPANPPATGFTLNALVPVATGQDFLQLAGRNVSLSVFPVGAAGNAQVGFALDINLTQAGQATVAWDFSDSFKDLQGTPFDEVPYQTPHLVFATDAHETVARGLAFYAGLELSGFFQNVATLLAHSEARLTADSPARALLAEDSQALTLSGTITPAASGTALALTCDLGVPTLAIGTVLKLKDLGVGVSLEYAPAGAIAALVTADAQPLVQIYLGATVELGNSSGASMPLDVRVLMPLNGNPDHLTLMVLPGAPFTTSLGNLGSLIAGQSWNELFSGDAKSILKYLDTFGLKSAAVDYSLRSFSVLSVAVNVGTLSAWPLWGDNSVTLDLQWRILFLPGGTRQNVLVSARFQFSQLTFTITVNIPSLVITGVEEGMSSFNLTDLNQKVFDGKLTIPQNLLDIEVAFGNFNISIDIPNKAYSIGAYASASFSLFGTQILGFKNCAIMVNIGAGTDPKTYTATLDGIVSLGPLEMQVDAVLSNQQDCVLTMHLVNETVGSMLNHLVHLVDPTFDIKFPSPWDKLLEISLDALVLQLNLTKGTLNLTYDTSLDLGFIDITGIALTYTKGTSAASSVQIELEGKFLGQSFGGASGNPGLGWDAINQSPPSVPGKGDQIFDLQYAGLGQYIAFKGDQPATIAAVMKALHDSVTPAQAGQLPDFGADGSLVFSQDSNWLIGAQFSVLGTLSISAIFNDPNLYGILIQLSGEKARIFAGLSFEILYRKISDNLGVYHIELKLPDAMRNLQFGEVSVTLPIIVLDVYTNGNFRVDFGFPKGLDFSNSFALQVFPFVGYGGFYFALLDGATSTRVPKISNGTFSPVIEFGVALSIGVGKTIDEGILSGGITVTVIGILQGVLGWFNPTQPAPKEMYYWFQGSISIVGKLYATINFAIISASLDVTAYATVTLTIEAHQPIYIELSAGVSVRLSVKILFFTIHLSFSANVHASFTIGHATPTPWVLADGSGASSSKGALRQLRGQQTLHSTVLRHAGYARALRSARVAALLANSTSNLDWPAVLVFSQVQTLTLRALPSFTKSESDAQGVDAVLLFTAENSVDPAAQTLSEHRALFGAAPHTAAFNQLLEAMLLWAIHAQTGGLSAVSADDLESLQQQLKQPETVAAAFDYTTLTNFLAANFVFNVATASQWTIETAARASMVVTITTPAPHGLTAGDAIVIAGVTDASFNGQFTVATAGATTFTYAQDAADAQSSGGTVDETTGVAFFPMIPAIKLSDTAGTSVDFGSFNSVDESYQAKAAAYFQLLQTQFQERNNSQSRNAALTDPPPISYATVIFTHYFNMLMSAGIKAALDLLQSYRYETPTAQSIGDIAAILDATLTAEPLRLVAPNQDNPVLAQGALFTLPNVVRQVRSGDTVANIAAQFAQQGARNANGQPYTVTDLFDANAAATGIYNTGLAVTFNDLVYTTQTNDTLNLIAVRLLLRVAGQSVINSLNGLGPAVQALSQANPGITGPNQPLAVLIAPQTGAVRAGGTATITTLTPHGLTQGAPVNLAGVSDASFNGSFNVADVLTPLSFTYQQTGLPDASSGNGVAAYPQAINVPQGNVYSVAPGDTLTLIAAYPLAFAQGLLNVTGFLAQLQALNPKLPTDPTQTLPPNTDVELPPVLRALAAGDSINTLATTLLTTPALIQTKLAAVPANTPLLAPQAVLHVPLQYAASAKTENQAGDTFSGIAAKFDLSLREVATQAVNVAGLFAAQQTLTVSDLPSIAVPLLLAGLLNQAEWNNASGQVSRFLLSGLRLPDPNDAYFQGLTLADMSDPAKLGPIKTLPLYQLTGQQYAQPAAKLGAYQLTLANAASVPWLQINGAASATFGLTADQQTLIGTIANSPIAPRVETLTRLALYQMTPPRLALQNHIAWQAAVLPGGCLSSGGVAGNPSLWLFPDSLVQQLAAANAQNSTALLYELVAAKHHDPSQPVTADEANCYAWATIVDVEIALPATDQPTPAVANAYVINGADDTGAALLQQVYQYLSTHSGTGAALYLLYSPNPASGNPSGLVSDQLDAAASYLLKTNLSTLTHSGGGDFAAFATVDPTSIYAAPLSATADFVALLWEASITRSGGFYLNYVNENGKAALPASVFGAATTAALSLLVVLDAQTASKDAAMLPFNNCVIVGDNIDTSTTTLFVQPALYTVQPGDSLTDAADSFNKEWGTSYGFQDVANFNQHVPLTLQVGAQLTVPNKPAYTVQYGDTLAGIAQAQFAGSLTALAEANQTAALLAAGGPLQFANGVLQPAATVPQGTVGFELTRTAPDPDTDVVDTLFNLTGFSIAAAGPFLQSCEGLPTTPADSWQAQSDGLTPRALDDVPATQWYYQQTLVINPFAAQPQGSTSPALPAAQNNPYNGIGAGAAVTLNLDVQDIFGNAPAQSVLPPLAVPVGYFDTLSGLASWPSLAVSYQVASPHGAPQIALNLTMQQARYIPSLSVPVAAAQAAIKADLASYQSIYYQLAQPDLTCALQTSLDTQTAAYALDKTPFFAFAYGAYVYLAALASMEAVQPVLDGTVTVGALAGQYGVTAPQLFEANQNTLLSKLFDGAALSVPQMYATVQSDSLQSIVSAPQWQSFHLTVTGLAALNAQVPLGAGVDLSAPAARTATAASTDTLNAVAQRAHAAVAALAVANAPTPGLLKQGTVLTVGTQQYTLAENDTFANAATQLNATVEAVALANQWLTNLFAGSVTLQVTDILSGAGDTLAGLAALVKSAVATLATANAQVQNLFAPTTDIQIGLNTQAAPPTATDTLASWAGKNQVTVAQLAQANLAQTFINGAQPTIPGALQQPTGVAGAAQYSTYVAAEGDTLAGIAQKFGTTAAALTALNAGLQTEVTPGSRWICPPMQGAAQGQNAQHTLAGLAAAYNTDVVTLAQANAATLGVLAAQIALPQWNLTTGAYETFNSLVNRLAQANILTEAGAAYTVAGVAQAVATLANLINPQALITPVPPLALDSNAVTITPHFAQAVFPLAVNVSLNRNPQWVDPDFANVAAVAQSTYSVRPEPDQSEDENAAFTFNQFATALQSALDGLFVATGDPLAEGDELNASTFWAVNFGNGAGPQLGYQFQGGQTAYFALPPLSTALLGGPVDIIPYVSGPHVSGPHVSGPHVSGQTPPFTGPAQTQTFQAVDLDVWLNTFLQSIDLFLSPAYAVPAYALSPADVVAVIEHKKSLAQKLAQRVTLVLQDAPTGSIDDAQAALQQALLTQLSSAFTVDTLVQVPVGVTSAVQNPLAAPRLSGQVVLAQGDQQLPNAFSFSTAKVGLTEGGATATFLFSVKAPAAHKEAQLNLQYSVNEMELPDPHSVIGDYEGSSWLKFIQPLPAQTGTCNSIIGNLAIPIPLRAYPSPVSLVTQSAQQSVPLPASAAELLHWDFGFVYQHDDAQQDTPLVAVTFNAGAQTPPRAAPTDVDVQAIFQALAQFMSAYPALKNDLALLPLTPPGAAPATARAAVRAFAQLVSWVDAAWQAQSLPNAALLVTDTFNYQLQKQQSADAAPVLTTLTLAAVDPATGQAKPNPSQLWPDVFASYNNTEYQLAQLAANAAQAVYQYPASAKIPADAALAQRFVFSVDGSHQPASWTIAPVKAGGAARAQGLTTITTTAPHALNPGARANISGVADASFNGTFAVSSVPTPLTITFPQPNTPDATSGGGTAAESLLPAGTTLSAPQSFLFRAVNILARQNGRAGVEIARNLNLVAAPTNPAFVYRTPLVNFASAAVPLVNAENTIPLNTVNTLPSVISSVAQALGEFLKQLFSGQTGALTMRLAAAYAYPLAQSTPDESTLTALSPLVPITLIPAFAFNPASDWDWTQAGSFVSQVQAVLDAWRAQPQHDPLPPRGLYLFDLTVYAGDSQLQPLIHTASLQYQLDAPPTQNLGGLR
ncbi:MAG: LysM peptidoglycan-binding domain-containing protein [Acidobacteria bacterium]|nr:LysM peptidoglycan-binding domain-containing protein [Acidobacteriota bacterium]